MEQDTTGTTTVAAVLTDKIGQAGPLGFLDVLAMGASIADALGERATPHGQVSPATIVEDPASGDDSWSLLDQAAARGANPEVAVAPELEGGEASGPGDVYALGAVMVFALTGHPFEPAVGGANGTADEPAPNGSGSGADPTTSPAGDTADDRTLPEVMASFLATLRLTLASAPADRPAPAALATSLRALRVEAGQAMEGVAIGAGAGDTLTQVVMIAADGTLLNADGQVIGTTRRDAPPPGRQWLPLAIAALALIVAIGVVVVYATRPEQVAFAPTTTVATTTTLLVTTTTAPPETVPPSTLPAGLVAVAIDTSKSVSCRNCIIPLRSLPTKTASVTAQFPDKTELWAKCFITGDPTDDSGYSSDKWLFIAGPSGVSGWISIVWVGRQTYGLPGCPPVQAPATTATTLPPTTVPTTAAPTTVPTTAVPTTVPTTVPPTTVPTTKATTPVP